MTLAEKIRQARLDDQPKLSQQIVADAIGLDRSMVALYELGRRRLSPERARQIMAAIQRLRDAKRFADSILDRATEETRRQVSV